MTREDMRRDALSSHCSKADLVEALSALKAADLVSMRLERSSGNNKLVERWKLK
jgi:hypothetical protein